MSPTTDITGTDTVNDANDEQDNIGDRQHQQQQTPSHYLANEQTTLLPHPVASTSSQQPRVDFAATNPSSIDYGYGLESYEPIQFDKSSDDGYDDADGVGESETTNQHDTIGNDIVRLSAPASAFATGDDGDDATTSTIRSFEQRLFSISEPSIRVQSLQSKLSFPSGLDFERVVNYYSIQATRERLIIQRELRRQKRRQRRNKLIEKFQWRNPFKQRQAGTTTSASSKQQHRQVHVQDEQHEGLASSPIANYSYHDDVSLMSDSIVEVESPPMTQQYKYQPGERDALSLPPPPPPPPPMMTNQSLRYQHPRQSQMTQRPIPSKGSSMIVSSVDITRWILIILTGVLTGIVSVLVVICVDPIQTWTANTLDRFWQQAYTPGLDEAHHHVHQHPPVYIFMFYIATNLVFAIISALLCLYIAPEAIGSGIPEVKAYLNGVRVKRFSSFKLLVVKFVATILSISSGLAIGKEGPSIHIGAIIGASCTKISNLLLRYVVPIEQWIFARGRNWKQYNSRVALFVTTTLSSFSTDAERRDLVGIGAAAGFAASFGAPIGGLLFCLEATSSYYETHMFLRTLVGTTVGTFCMAFYKDDLSQYSIINLGNYDTPNHNIFLNRVEELPLYAIVGIIGGILGGTFIHVWKHVQLWRGAGPSDKTTKLLQVVILSLVSSTIMYYVPLMEWTCHEDYRVGDLERNIFHSRQFDCPNGQINNLANIMFGSRLSAISSILTDPNQFTIATLLTVGCIFYPLMTVSLGVAIPSGIYTPTFLVGTSLGGAAGLFFQEVIDPNISASTFSLLGAAALLVSIQRSTVSHCVILVEGTGQVKVLIPVIFTAVISRSIAGYISPLGLFETGMEIKKFPYLEHTENKSFDVIRVADIMSTPVECIKPRERASRIVELLRDSSHNGFPVVDPMTGVFLGLVRRDQLVALLECGIFDNENDDDDVFPNKEYDDEPIVSAGSAGSPRRTSSGRTSTAGSQSRTSSRYSDPDYTPKAGPNIHKSPLLHLAYHIKDDRYDHLNLSTRNEHEKAGNDGKDEKMKSKSHHSHGTTSKASTSSSSRRRAASHRSSDHHHRDGQGSKGSAKEQQSHGKSSNTESVAKTTTTKKKGKHRSRHRVVDSFDQNVWLDSVLERLDSTISTSQRVEGSGDDDVGLGIGSRGVAGGIGGKFGIEEEGLHPSPIITTYDDSFVVHVGDDSLPPLKKPTVTTITTIELEEAEQNQLHPLLVATDAQDEPRDSSNIDRSSIRSTSTHSTTTTKSSVTTTTRRQPKYAVVTTDEKGHVIIEELMKEEYYSNWVNVGAVMNLGTYTVTEFCPVSKAKYLFTALGLRHLIVLGSSPSTTGDFGASDDNFGDDDNAGSGGGGGKVVGVITRINLLKEYIQEKTGVYDL